MTAATIPDQTTYQRLAAPFDHTFQDERGGRSFDYITGEQCVSRLNEVLGPNRWSFRVLEHGIDDAGDEAWALGEIQAVIDGDVVVRQQFGANAIKRSRSTGTPISLGDDRKAAATDAMKKCASWIGVALYLSHKAPQQNSRPAARAPQPHRPAAPAGQSPTPLRPDIRCKQPTGELDDAKRPLVCNAPLADVPEKGWTAVQLANEGQALIKRPLCWSHFQKISQSGEHRSTG